MMLSSELRDKRIKSGLTQKDLAILLDISTSSVAHLESGTSKISKDIEKKINKVINDKYTLAVTNKIFSRESFLKSMLTGNKVIDDIYINADWLKKLDKKPVFLRGSQKDYSFQFKGLRVRNTQKQYVTFGNTSSNDLLFFCKEAWLVDK